MRVRWGHFVEGENECALCLTLPHSASLCLLACLSVALCCFAPAHAQYSQNSDVNYMQISARGWLFCPATSANEIRGFLALLEDGLAIGSNIELVWYQREANGSWTSWGWEQRDLGEAVWWVRSHLNDPLAFTLDVELNEAAESVEPEAATPPVPLVNGLFFDDPIQPVVQQSENAAAVVDGLAVAGWQVAPIMSSLEAGGVAPCDQQSVNAMQSLLNDLASDVEMAYFGTATISSTCSWPCKCTYTYGAPTCGAWTFLYSVPQSGGGLVCHYSRSCTRTWTSTGETWLLCRDCAATGTENYIERARTNALPGDPCMPPP